MWCVNNSVCFILLLSSKQNSIDSLDALLFIDLFFKTVLIPINSFWCFVLQYKSKRVSWKISLISGFGFRISTLFLIICVNLVGSKTVRGLS